MQNARTFTRSDLPETMRMRHGDVPRADRTALHTLLRHSQTTIDGILTTVGGTADLPREDLVAQALADLDDAQVLMVVGTAGSGKSVIAKKVVSCLSFDHVCLAFRAEEFAKSHLDATLSFAGIDSQRLMGMLAGQSRTVIWIDSVERLLEAPIRDAFADLLRLSQQDPSIRLILTCRDYSAETVRTSLLEPTAISSTLLQLPLLNDDELTAVSEALPALCKALGHPGLRSVLRSPYFLSIAARMDWSSSEALPENEREFRERCWKEVVRRDVAAADGMPRRRERAFFDVTLRRARELRPFVGSDSMDESALQALVRDSLITTSEELVGLVAPAHDVLEDWAILRWLDTVYSTHEGDIGLLAGEVGGHPAIRRSYRKWLGELLSARTEQVGALPLSALQNDAIPPWFRDDTLIAMLLSPDAGDFLARHYALLLRDGGSLLIRVIHILRVACKAPVIGFGPNNLGNDKGWLQLQIPKGSAWAAVLKIVDANISEIANGRTELVLDLLEDWVDSVTWTNVQPAGFSEAGMIAFALLNQSGGYDAEDFRKRLFKVIARIPKANPEAFQVLLERGCLPRQDNYTAAEFATFILSGVSGAFACRDFPAQMVNLALANFCLSESNLKRLVEYGSTMDIEPFFGIYGHTDFTFFPASAIRGTFLSLLRHHPHQGIDLIITLLNHAGEWYGERRCPGFRLEPAQEVVLRLPDGTEVTQWANYRLWQLYRGTSVGPHVLQSALMALESWLLTLCEKEEIEVEPWLIKLLRESNNVALTAVVASVCTAHPARGRTAAVTLLTSPDVIWMDKDRMSADMTHTTIADIGPMSIPENRIYETERKHSDGLKHRQHDLELLAVQLQFTTHRDEVWKVLDEYRAELQTVEDPNGEYRPWRLALHRMDIRGFRAETINEDNTQEELSDQSDAGKVLFGPGLIEPDIQEMIEESTAKLTARSAGLPLFNWGSMAWSRIQKDQYNLNLWEEMLSEARSGDAAPEAITDHARRGVGFVAAVCVRDHWEDMGQEDRAWCTVRLISEIERNCDTDNYDISQSRGALLYPDRAAAFALPRVFFQSTEGNEYTEALAAIAKALTHSVHEVRIYAAEGVGNYAKGVREGDALAVAAALAKGAASLVEATEAQSERSWEDQIDRRTLRKDADLATRELILSGKVDPHTDLASLMPVATSSQLTILRILQILRYFPTSDIAKASYKQMSQELVREWDAKYSDRHSQPDFGFEYTFERLRHIARFLLTLPAIDALNLAQPIVSAAAKHPKEVAEFVESLIYAEDECVGVTPFWDLWQAFADELCKANWATDLDERYARGRELLRALFLQISWKPKTRYWPHLEGNEHRIAGLIEALPPSSASLGAYCRLLFNIGERMLPSAFLVVAACLRRGEPTSMLGESDTLFMLDHLLPAYVYGEPLKLKKNPDLRASVLLILDELVEAGSSAAFQMRDDFVTPIGDPN